MNYMPILSSACVTPSTEPEWNSGLSAMFKRRAPRIWQMAHIAAQRALDSTEAKPNSIVCATALGALDETRGYLEGVFKDGFGSPKNFIASVHNSMAGKLALDFGISGPNMTVCEGQNSFASAIVTAMLLDKKDFPVLLVAVDEKIELLQQIIPHLSEPCKKYLNEEWTEAAVCFIIDSPREKQAPCISAAGPRRIAASDPQQACVDLANEIGLPGREIAPLDETSDSFLKPAHIACQQCAGSSKGDHLIGSFSPTAQAVALVSLCL